MTRYLVLASTLFIFLGACSPGSSSNDIISFGEPILLSDNGGWCWFQGPRIVSDGEYVVIGSVAIGDGQPERRGDVDAIVYNLSTSKTETVTLADRLQANDHATPALLLRPDGKWLSVYTRHNDDNYLMYRISEPGNPTKWNPEQQYIPSETTLITYSNLHMLRDEGNRIYNFFRGLDNSWKPSFVYSDNLGESWETGNIFIDVPGEYHHRPYVNYASDGINTIHMIYTEGHPRDYNNSIYHIYYRDGILHQSTGEPVAAMKEGLMCPEEGTLVYPGSADSIHWTADVVLDENDYPRIVFSNKKTATEKGQIENGNDQRYHYGRWDGERWHVHQMAYAGTKLYPGEDEYTGLAAIDPNNPNVVYISADAQPDTGEPLISETSGNRHYELFRGVTRDGGKTWEWTAITKNSESDNLRPIATDTGNGRTFLAWLRGEYRTYTDYNQKVVGFHIGHQ